MGIEEVATRLGLSSALASKEMQVQRLGICVKCERLVAKHICGGCGCIVQFKAKILTAGCPSGKWPKL